MGTNSEKFCLRWNDFESNISVAFREIREEKDFFDCTLSCGARQIQAHKLILSACSPFFRSILRQNPHQNPLLYLKGVEFTDLQAVLNFMYHGEVNVAQEELNSFLSVAEDLQVKGLTQNESSQSNPKPETISRPNLPRRESQEPLKRSRPPASHNVSQPSYPDDQDDIQEVLPVVKSEPDSQITPAPPLERAYTPQVAQVKYQPPAPIPDQQPMGELVHTMDDSSYGYGDDGYDYGGYEGDEGYDGAAADQMEADTSKGIHDCVVRVGNAHRCVVCGRDFSEPQNCRRHVREKHFGLDQENCPHCRITIAKRNLKAHIAKCKAIASF